MTRIATLLRLDGGPSDPSLVASMLAAAGEPGAHPGRTTCDGACAAGASVLPVLPEDSPGGQPVVARDGTTAVMTGRVDDREQLAVRLGVRFADHRDRNDTWWALHAFLKYRANFFDHVHGDIALVVWEPATHTMTALRDPMGVRGLCFAQRSGWLAVASLPEMLLTLPFVTDEIDEGYLGEELAGMTVSLTDTLYRDVQRIPPGHLLSASVGRHAVASRRLWAPPPLAPGGLRRDLVVEPVRALLIQAVQRRARARGPVAAELSGGFDSSTVVGVLASLAPSLDATPVAASIRYDHPNADERRFVDAVIAATGLPFVTTHDDPDAYLAAVDYAQAHRRLPDIVDAGTWRALAHGALGEHGARVRLTGHPGDGYLGEDVTSMVPAFLAHRLRARAAWATWRSQSRAPWTAFPRHAVGPAAFRTGWQRAVPPWIVPAFAARIDLADRLRPARSRWTRAGIRNDLLDDPTNVRWLENDEAISGWMGIESRHPYLDRDLAVFLASLPPTAIALPRDRSLHRLVADGFLPRRVRMRTDKAGFEHIYERTLSRLGGLDAMARSRPVSLGMVTPPSRWQTGPLFLVWPQVWGVDAWLSHREWPLGSVLR
jgi:asparagine synthase (glutamine-hydrolysing)